jgi:hypothetical protein
VLRVGPGGKLGSHSPHRCVNATAFSVSNRIFCE